MVRSVDSIGTVLVIVAHPDDAELFAGGTIARFADEGWTVLYVIATAGDKGSFELASYALATVREEEARRAAEIVGVKEVVLLGHADGELGDLPPGVLRERFMRLIRQRKPSVLITWDPFAPYETHPDHRAVALAAAEAAEFAPLPLYHPEHLADGLEPHYVTDKYFFAKHPVDVNRVVDITPYIEKKLAALACHASQMEFLIEDVVRQLRAAGLEAEALELSESDSAASVARFVRGWAREAGAQTAVEYGEAFRYVRCSPIVEQLILARSKESLP
jgi:LmbE family N-acetylglucosaminyl deacetylase